MSALSIAVWTAAWRVYLVLEGDGDTFKIELINIAEEAFLSIPSDF